MRVLHIINYFQPVLGYQETYLAQSELKKGYQVRVITSDRYAPGLYRGNASECILGKRIKKPGMFIEEGIEVLRLETHFEFLNNVYLHDLEKSVFEFHPDVIIVHGIVSITAIRIARLKSKLQNTKFIFDDHMNFTVRRGKWIFIFYKLFNLLLIDTISKNADSLVAVTKETKVFMNKIYGLPLDEIDIIPLGCDTTKFHFDNNFRNILRDKYKINRGEVIFCYVGKIIPAKGVDLLVDAAIRLMQNKRNIYVMMVGGGDYKYLEMIQEKVKDTIFEHKFIVLPGVPSHELYKYYSMADVGVWPKQCSITMLEAMACNLPVIISDNSEATEGVAADNSGLTYQEGNSNDLSEKMEYLLNPEIRLEMGKKARKIAEQYDWENISNRFEYLFQD